MNQSTQIQNEAQRTPFNVVGPDAGLHQVVIVGVSQYSKSDEPVDLFPQDTSGDFETKLSHGDIGGSFVTPDISV